MFEESEEFQKKSTRVILIFTLLGAILFILFGNYNSNEFEKAKKTFKGETIGLATRIEHRGRQNYLRYYFYSNRKILSEVSIRSYSGSDLKDKFYKIKYNLNDPEEHYIILEEELKPDSLELVKAGFTKTKYYTYDDVKAEYLGEWKWK
ncbi:MAG: hypothetical protein REI96_08045 [Flavobacterium nitrogenifigens]|uniref:hypothetical protein n=1 Tax=Flavobacterium nitrogenifigens TaxID=1617283 RepID=UPI002807CA1C|nr:hypothetical protein [Flavobacterium nitrogenifigens]MDQ8012382.1 hypothetical protein [Flavobacterium nitrogenifigens]